MSSNKPLESRRVTWATTIELTPLRDSHASAPNIPKQEIEQAADAVEKFQELVGKK